MITYEELLDAFPGTPRPQQEMALREVAKWFEGVDELSEAGYFGIDAPTGCHARGTKILMYDGRIKKVEDIVEGEQLMGPDSKPRKVLALYRGREVMYRVIPHRYGVPFVCNESHILSLVRTVRDSSHNQEQSKQGRKRRVDFEGRDKIVNISIRDYLNKSRTFHHTHKLYRTGVDFQESSVPREIPPYILGLWLGDGSSSQIELTSCDPEIYQEWLAYGESFGMIPRVSWKGKTGHFFLTEPGPHKNPIKELFKRYELINNKHIPQTYLTAPRQERLELLAGLIDTDGYLGPNNSFEISSVSKILAEQIVFLARSLGFGVSQAERIKLCQTGNGGTYQIITISGNITEIPTRLSRKKATERKMKKSVLRTGFSLEKLPEDDFFGFELDGDHLYLLGDFTVTHNTGKSFLSIAIAKAVHKKTGGQVWIVTQNKLLQDQYMADFPDDLFCLKGLGNYNCYHDIGKTCDESRCGRIRKKKEDETFPKICPRNCEYDEATAQARRSSILMLNAAKAFNIIKTSRFIPNPWYPAMIIYDEGHGVEPQLDNEASFMIKAEELEKIGLNFFDYFEKPSIGEVDDLVQRLKGLRKDAGRVYSVEESAPDSFRDLKKLKKSESICNKVDELISNIDEKNIEYVNASTECIDLRPLQVHGIFEKFLGFPTIFLSATLLSKEGFCSTVGLEPQDVGWVSIDSPFPVQNRKIYNFFPIGSKGLTYQNQEEQTPVILERVREMLLRHPKERGIIHTHTYKWALKIFDLNNERDFRGRFLYPRNAAEQKEILKIHSESDNTVLLSPSMTEGVDLKADLARFCGLVKVPYLPINDPVIQARMNEDELWYGYKSIMTFIQAAGRGVRSTEDYCVTYLLDPGFVKFINRYRSLFPKWFLDAYEKGKYLGSV